MHNYILQNELRLKSVYVSVPNSGSAFGLVGRQLNTIFNFLSGEASKVETCQALDKSNWRNKTP